MGKKLTGLIIAINEDSDSYDNEDDRPIERILTQSTSLSSVPSEIYFDDTELDFQDDDEDGEEILGIKHDRNLMEATIESSKHDLNLGYKSEASRNSSLIPENFDEKTQRKLEAPRKKENIGKKKSVRSQKMTNLTVKRRLLKSDLTPAA